MRSLLVADRRIRLVVLFFAVIAGVFSFLSTDTCKADHFNIATDQNFWHPFTYTEKDEAKGIHIDLVAQALGNLGHSATFTPLPWKRCLFLAKQGDIDAVVSASYKPERSAYLIYPPDAATHPLSRWRITQVDYAIVVPYDCNYKFDGKISGLPEPVRVPLGYAIADDLRKQGLTVHTSVDTRLCIRQLAQSGRGVVVTPSLNARYFMQNKTFREKLKILPDPLISKSYFMVFARSSEKADLAVITSIWNEIERLRNDTVYLEKVFKEHIRADKRGF